MATTPQKIQSSISVQTTPRMLEDSSPSLPPPEGNVTNQPATEISNIDGIEPALPTPSPSIRSIYTKAQPVQLIPTAKQPESPNLENSSSSDEDRPVM